MPVSRDSSKSRAAQARSSFQVDFDDLGLPSRWWQLRIPGVDWFKVSVPEFTTGELISRMDSAALGVFMRLQVSHWENGSLPRHDRALAAAARTSVDELRLVWPQLEPAFKAVGDAREGRIVCEALDALRRGVVEKLVLERAKRSQRWEGGTCPKTLVLRELAKLGIHREGRALARPTLALWGDADAAAARTGDVDNSAGNVDNSVAFVDECGGRVNGTSARASDSDSGSERGVQGGDPAEPGSSSAPPCTCGHVCGEPKLARPAQLPLPFALQVQPQQLEERGPGDPSDDQLRALWRDLRRRAVGTRWASLPAAFAAHARGERRSRRRSREAQTRELAGAADDPCATGHAARPPPAGRWKHAATSGVAPAWCRERARAPPSAGGVRSLIRVHRPFSRGRRQDSSTTSHGCGAFGVSAPRTFLWRTRAIVPNLPLLPSSAPPAS